MRFVSKYKKYTIVLKSSYFRTVDGVREFVAGETVKFQDGLFRTEDEKLIKKLRAHPAYGRDFWSEEKTEKTPEAELQEKIEEEAKAKIETSCPYCPFKAKSKFGLMAHIRAKHKGE